MRSTSTYHPNRASQERVERLSLSSQALVSLTCIVCLALSGTTGCQFSFSGWPEAPDGSPAPMQMTDMGRVLDEGVIIVEDGSLGDPNNDLGVTAGEIIDAPDAEVRLSEAEELNLSLDIPTRECDGPWMCSRGEGCRDGACGECGLTSECPRGDVCRGDGDGSGGQCGRCDDAHPCAEGDQCLEGVCLPTMMRVVSLSLSPDAWARFLDSRYERGEWVPCGLRVGEMSDPESVLEWWSDQEQACRLKVHGGSSRDLRKLSLRVDLRAPSEELAWGDDQLLLRAEYNDPTMLRNVLSHQAFARFTDIPHSRWRYTWVLVNGETYGLYLQIERHRASMISRWGRDAEAPRYESDPPLEMFARGAGGLVTLDNQAEYWTSYELKGGASYTPLINFIEDKVGMASTNDWLTEGGAGELAAQFDWGSYLKYLALMTRLQNHDHVRKNFLISRQLDGARRPRWEVYPWDLDLSWGCLYNNETGLTLCDELTWDGPLDFGLLGSDERPSYPTDGFYNVLMSRALGPESALERYQEQLCELSSPDESDPNLARLTAWRLGLAQRLEPWIDVDPQRNQQVMGTYQSQVDDLARFWSERGSLIRSSLDCPE